MLARGIAVGVAAAPLAAVSRGLVALDVALVRTLALLRVDTPGTLAHLRRLLRVAAF